MPEKTPGEEYISLRDLHDLSWPTRLVWQLLGLPDLSSTPEPFPKLPGRQLYRRERVMAASRPDDRRFQELRLTSTLRDIFRFQAGLDEAIRWAERVPLRADLPRMGWEELVELGLEHRRTFHGEWVPERERRDPGSLATLAAYVYLKHERTNYDEICEFIRGRPYARFIYPVLLHRFNRLVLDAHPECLPRVKGMKRSIAFICRRCGRTARGRHNGHYFEKPDRWMQRLSHQDGKSIQTFCSKRCSMPGANRGEDDDQLCLDLQLRRDHRGKP